MAPLHLVRHTEVAAHWKGRCYGRSEAGLSRAGRDTARALVPNLLGLEPKRIVVSPRRRARFLAGLVAQARPGLPVTVVPDLAECHFGAWEGKTWDGIYADTGDAMLGMIQDPSGFRPGGDGETTEELRARVMGWFESLDRREPVLAIAHGGPIAALLGTLAGLPVTRWPALVPPYGALVTIPAS